MVLGLESLAACEAREAEADSIAPFAAMRVSEEIDDRLSSLLGLLTINDALMV